MADSAFKGEFYVLRFESLADSSPVLSPTLFPFLFCSHIFFSIIIKTIKPPIPKHILRKGKSDMTKALFLDVLRLNFQSMTAMTVTSVLI